MADDQDWRLEFELDVTDTRGALDHMLGRVRDPGVTANAKAAVSHEVVVTHDGKRLFAYAATEETISQARRAIEGVLQHDGVRASSCRVSHWDDELDAWRLTDPPPTAEEQRNEGIAERGAETVQTRTMVVSAGKLVRPTVEQAMLEWAAKLGVECTFVEHPHLLATQVGFTVTGPKGKIEEFAEGLRAEELATMRTERWLMLSPL
jgi:hypothetical protein